MTARKNLLDRIEITSPCTANWDQMTGTNQIRSCSECNKYVFNLAEMTRREAEALVRSSEGRMCARMIRDLEGKTITVDSLPPVRLMSWRPGPIASAVVSAMISIAPSAAMSKDLHGSSTPSYSTDGAARKRTLPSETTASLVGTVFNESSTPMFGAVVTITSEASGDVLSQISLESGEFRFDGLPARTYIVEIQSHDYALVRKHDG